MNAARLLTITEAAEYIGRPVATLYDWRYKRTGPRSAKLGGRVAYRQADLDAWLDAQFDAGVGDELDPKAAAAGAARRTPGSDLAYSTGGDA